MWLTERAQVVEEMTGQMHTTAQLLQLAQQFNPEDVLARQLSTVASLQDGLPGISLKLCLLHLGVALLLSVRMCVPLALTGPMMGSSEMLASCRQLKADDSAKSAKLM